MNIHHLAEVSAAILANTRKRTSTNDLKAHGKTAVAYLRSSGLGVVGWAPESSTCVLLTAPALRRYQG